VGSLRLIERVKSYRIDANHAAPVNGVLLLLTLALTVVWVLIYTDWLAPITNFFGLVALAGGVISAFFAKKMLAKWVRSPWCLLVPAVFFLCWIVSLFSATLELIVVDSDFKSVVEVYQSGATTPIERKAPSVSHAAVLRLPVWRTRIYDVSTPEDPRKPFTLNRWWPTQVFLPKDLQRWQIYFKPTEALIASASKQKRTRLRIMKSGKDLDGRDPWSLSGVVIGGTDDTGLLPPADTKIEFLAPSFTLSATDTIEAVVEVWTDDGRWVEYGKAQGTPNEKPGTREVKLDLLH
jgi:hypothetical protein